MSVNKFSPKTTLETFTRVAGPKIQSLVNKNKLERHIRPQTEFCDLKKTSRLYHVVCAKDVVRELAEHLSNWNGNVWERYRLKEVFQNYTAHTTHTREHFKGVDKTLRENPRTLCRRLQMAP